MVVLRSLSLIGVSVSIFSIVSGAHKTATDLERGKPSIGFSANKSFSMDDVFDDAPVGEMFKKPANHFGISIFDYFSWAITAGYLDHVFNQGEDMEALTNEHLEFLKMPWTETEVEEFLKDAEVPVENIKQTLVGALIAKRVSKLYEKRGDEISDVISDVVGQLKLRDPELDEEALELWANQALRYIMAVEQGLYQSSGGE